MRKTNQRKACTGRERKRTPTSLLEKEMTEGRYNSIFKILNGKEKMSRKLLFSFSHDIKNEGEFSSLCMKNKQKEVLFRTT